MRERCYYGCGREAKYQFKNGRWCCSKRHQSCPSMKKRYEIKKNYKPHLAGFKPLLECRKCKELYPIDDFYDKGIKYVFCSECRKDYQYEQYWKRTKRYNPVKFKARKTLAKLRQTAKTGRREVDLDYFTYNKLKEMFENNRICEVCNEEMLITHRKPTAKISTLDRVDNSKGYVKGNVRVICLRCNGIKSDS